MQVGLIAKHADPMLLAAVKLLKASDDLPDVWASGKSGTPIMPGAAKDDPWIVELIDALHDELAKQSGGSHALAGSP